MFRSTFLSLILTAASAVALAQAVPPSANVGGATTTSNVGAINYVEGRAYLNGRLLQTGSGGNPTLAPGQRLTTINGKVEVLLTPGVFLRLGNHSTLRLISPDLTHTEVALDRGQADVEVDQIYKENTLLVDLPSGQVQMLNHGLYAFHADQQLLQVFSGEAAMYPGSDYSTDIKPVYVKSSQQIQINAEPGHPQHFDKNYAQDALYRWSSLRSKYLGEANQELAENYAADGGSYYPGWYWAGGPYGYTWFPGDGLFWNPFGWGFYSPAYFYGPGFWGGGFYRGGFYGGRGFYGRGFGGGFHGGGFHGGGRR